MRNGRTQIALSIAITGDEPPNEFRIFRAGQNETTKGSFLFDEKAAAAVLAEEKAHGIDLMIDYDHASLGADHSPDPAQAGKAAGWFNLAVRGGELWAVNVRWTPPAAEALRRKEWRFMSPAFSTDSEGRVTSVLNVAITNLPATRRLEPLMAASVVALGEGNAMTLEEFLKVVKALGIDMSTSLDEAMAKIKGEAPAEEAPEEPAEETMAETPAEEEPEQVATVAAAASRLIHLTGKSTLGAAVEEVEVWRKSHIELEAEKVKLAKDRALLEAGERDELVAKMVASGAEPPSTAWEDPVVATNRAKRKPAEPWASMPMTALRARVAKLSKAAPAKKPPAADDATAGADVCGAKVFETPHGTVTLSASELRNCEEAKADPKVYAANKAIQLAARKRTGS